MNILKSDKIELHGAANSMQGGRPENQDDMMFLDTPLGFLAIICDGMGGGPGGKTASYIAKYEISNALCECTPQTPRDYAFKMATSRANEALEKKMKDVPSLQGMGSTFVAVLINNESAYIAHAGDSRCYVFRNGKCIYRSQDHSLVGELVRKKALTEEEARQSPQSNVITRGLGSTTNHVPDIEEIPFKKGDRFILCTDGVWGIMLHSELIKRFTQKLDIQQIITNISTEVDKIGFSKGGQHDNHTISVFETDTSSTLKPKVNLKKIAIVCSIISVTIAVITCAVIVFYPNGKKSNTNEIFGGGFNGIFYQNDSQNSESHAENDTTKAETERKNDDVPEGGIKVPNPTPRELKDSIAKMRRRAIEHQEDSISKQQDVAVSKSLETIQKVINRYGKAKAVDGATVEEAQKKLEGLRSEIKKLMKDLHQQCESNTNVYPTIEGIQRDAETNQASWNINREKDQKTDKYGVTLSSQRLMDKQIKRLERIKNKL